MKIIPRLAATIQFGPSFYSFHHHKYQQLHLCDIWQHVQMSEPLLGFVNNNESFSPSEKDNICRKTEQEEFQKTEN